MRGVGVIGIGQTRVGEHWNLSLRDLAAQAIDAVTIEAACASGGAAVRAAYLAVAGGAAETALAVGVEKMTDLLTDGVTEALATAADADYEAGHGVTFAALNALL